MNALKPYTREELLKVSALILHAMLSSATPGTEFKVEDAVNIADGLLRQVDKKWKS